MVHLVGREKEGVMPAVLVGRSSFMSGTPKANRALVATLIVAVLACGSDDKNTVAAAAQGGAGAVPSSSSSAGGGGAGGVSEQGGSGGAGAGGDAVGGGGCAPLPEWKGSFDVVKPAKDLSGVCLDYLNQAKAINSNNGNKVLLVDSNGNLVEPTQAEKNNPFLSKRRVVANYLDRQAVCNDGSPAVYFYRPGSVNKWIIHLEGGAACIDPTSCAARWNAAADQNKMSSCDEVRATEKLGILSPRQSDNPDFYNWHHVHVEYCSSDTWVGDVAPGAWQNPSSQKMDQRLWYFRGRRIVLAVLDDLMDPALTPAPNLGLATEVIFTGASAGSGGMRKNADWVREHLGQAQVCAIADAAIGFEEGPVPKGNPNPKEILLGAYMNPRPDSSCYAATCDPYRCSSADFIGLYYLETPTFFQMNQWDSKVNDAHDPVVTAEIRDLIAARNGGYSARQDGKHVYVTNEKWGDKSESSIAVGNWSYSYNQVFGAWYFDRDMVNDSSEGQKPGFKVVYRSNPNGATGEKKLGGMCGGAYK